MLEMEGLELMREEPQRLDGPAERVEELQAGIASDFDSLLRHMEMARMRQEIRLQALLDVLRPGSPQIELTRGRPSTTIGERAREGSMTMDSLPKGGRTGQTTHPNHQDDDIPTRTSALLMKGNDKTRKGFISWSNSNVSHATASSTAKAAAEAVGHTKGLLHTHIPPHVFLHGGMLGRVQRLFLRWEESWNNEPEREGWLARFVGGYLSYICMFVILVNATVIAAVANKEMANPKYELSPVFDNLEYVFIVLYLIEQILQLTVHRLYHFFGNDATWNWFDILVLTTSIMMLDPRSGGVGLTSVRSLRVLKVVRFLRLLRIFRFLSPLRHMLKALLASPVPLFWSLVMLACLIYMFALFFVQACSSRLADPDVLPGSPLWMELQAHFGSVEKTLFTLTASLTGGDWTEQHALLGEVGFLASMVYVFYIAFFNVAVLNIVTGVFVNAAMRLGQPDLDEQAMDKLREHMSHVQEVRAIANEIDSDGSGFLCQDELRRFICDPVSRVRLAVLGIDAKDGTSFVNLLAASNEDGKISINDFVNGCCRLTGGASSIDLQCHAFQIGLLLQRQTELMAITLGVSERLDHIVPSVSSQALPSRPVVARKDDEATTGETRECMPQPSQNENGEIGGREEAHPSTGAEEQHRTRSSL